MSNFYIEETEEKEPFQITDVGSLHWTFRTMRELQGEIAKKEDLAQVEYDRLEEEKKLVDEWLDNDTKAFRQSLEKFEHLVTIYHMEELERDEGQKTLSSPFGKTSSITSQPQPEKGDEVELLQYAKDNKLTELIKVEESVRWGDLKKTLKVVGNNVVDSNGEIVKGTKVKPKNTTFKVELL